MKEVIFNKEYPKGLVREVENTKPQAEILEQKPTTEERLEVLESAILELAEVLCNG